MTVDGAHSEKPLWFFLERYNQAFIEQVMSFVDCGRQRYRAGCRWRYRRPASGLHGSGCYRVLPQRRRIR